MSKVEELINEKLSWFKESIGMLNNAITYMKTMIYDNRDKANLCLEFLKSREEFLDWHRTQHLIYETERSDSDRERSTEENDTTDV